MQYKKKDINYRLIFVLLIIIVLGITLFKKPTITAKVVSEETVFSENLNLQVNESGTYEWNVKNPGKIKSLKVSGSVTSNGTARVFIEKNGTRQLLFDSAKQLFDVNVHVLPEYKKVLQGGEILLQITLLNLRGFGSGNVNVKYSIKDSRGNIIASEQETVFVETQAKFVRKLLIPTEIKPGTYVAFVEGFTDINVGSGSDTFEVTAKYQVPYYRQLKFYLIIAAIIVALFIALIIVNYVAKLKKKKEITKLKEKIPLEKVQKFEKELKALEEGYKAKLISEETYNKEKARIERELEKLRR